MIQCKNINIDNRYIHVELNDGRILSTPLSWYPVLLSADDSERKNYKLIARKTMIEWESLDLHIDIEEMFNIQIVEHAA
ncbi:MAG: DUF2442 domain-containing protein [Desulfamplus sp.]